MVYSLKEFESFQPTKRTFAVMGDPIHHSLSPTLHNELKKECGEDFEYIALQVSANEFPHALELARQKLSGFNLTMPLKQLVIPHLDQLSADVTKTGSANTVLVKDGKLFGFTTDGCGLRDVLLSSFSSLDGKRILILGAGGASRSVAVSLAQCGAEVTVAVRSDAKGKLFVSELAMENINYTMFDTIADTYDILINATPVGMEQDSPAPVDLSRFSRLQFVYDCIYNPPMTKLLKDAKTLGIKYDNGLSMLIMQGVYAEKCWFDAEFSPKVIDDVILKLRAKLALSRLNSVYGKSNIVLTGFMGSGKTTIGQKLAKILQVEFIDLDAKIEEEQKMKITEIFDKYGEEHFRKLETLACKDCLELSNMVIATGGGTVIRFGNDRILKENSLIIFLNRSIEEIERHLEGSVNRPLLNVNNVKEHIHSLYALRQPQYLEKSDISVSFSPDKDPINEILLHI